MTNNDYIKTVTEYNKQAYDSVKELAEINRKSIESIAEQQLAMVSLVVEANSKYLELFGQANGYKEVLSGQAELGADFSGKALGIARNTAEILTESRDEVGSWVEKQAKSVPDMASFAPKKAA